MNGDSESNVPMAHRDRENAPAGLVEPRLKPKTAEKRGIASEPVSELDIARISVLDLFKAAHGQLAPGWSARASDAEFMEIQALIGEAGYRLCEQCGAVPGAVCRDEDGGARCHHPCRYAWPEPEQRRAQAKEIAESITREARRERFLRSLRSDDNVAALKRDMEASMRQLDLQILQAGQMPSEEGSPVSESMAGAKLGYFRQLGIDVKDAEGKPPVPQCKRETDKHWLETLKLHAQASRPGFWKSLKGWIGL